MSDKPVQAPGNGDLEIKDAQVIFNTAWEELTESVGREQLRFPKELILLGGAPGSGKGTQTEFIMGLRGLTCPPIVVSSLLDTPEARRIKDAGGLVGDKEVFSILLRKLLEPQFRDGAVLDGFPRTQVQVQCLQALVDRITQLHGEFADTPLATQFRRPTVHAMVLFVTERTSVDRQLQRGKEIAEHNREVEETGVGEAQELRSTDVDAESAQRRYRVFKEQTWDALTSLKEIYHYHFVNAEGPVSEVEQNILRELQYQSSLELDPRTFDRLLTVPLATDLTVHARQELVRRLDSYELDHTDLFVQIVDMVREKFMPIVQRHAISGRAVVNSEDEIFEDPLALSMLIDIFSERGFQVVVDKTIAAVATRVDLTTGDIEHARKAVYRINVVFQGSEIRRG
ncbi:MAG: nucleoside monophosphate kinase [Gammaproteobacteria bacterium]